MGGIGRRCRCYVALWYTPDDGSLVLGQFPRCYIDSECRWRAGHRIPVVGDGQRATAAFRAGGLTRWLYYFLLFLPGNHAPVAKWNDGDSLIVCTPE